jgi:cobalt/nickel transport system permease protein
MHIPDGFIDIPTSAGAALLTMAGLGVTLKAAKNKLDERSAPLIGLVAVFIFAVQMLNFPVAAGTSGHLLGGALAVVLVGPYAATLALTVVLLIQGLLFADGGLTALGLNIFNMGFVGVWVSYGIFVLIYKLLARFSSNKTSVVIAGAIAAFISVPAAAAAFVFEYWIGGVATYSTTTVLGAMVGTHILIGIGEAVITFLTISAVISTRKDLVYGANKVKTKSAKS